MSLVLKKLNLLLAFDVLMRERHVSRAAALLNISQSAMSKKLEQLRDMIAITYAYCVRTLIQQTFPTRFQMLLSSTAVLCWLMDNNKFATRTMQLSLVISNKKIFYP